MLVAHVDANNSIVAAKCVAFIGGVCQSMHFLVVRVSQFRCHHQDGNPALPPPPFSMSGMHAFSAGFSSLPLDRHHAFDG